MPSIQRYFQLFSSITVTFVLAFSIIFASYPVHSEDEAQIHILFLHGMPETPNVLIPLKEKLDELFTSYNMSLDFCYPHLPDCESVDTWAHNVAEKITTWDPSEDIVIVGLSMGGKVAVHLTANERFGVQDQIDSVITINSPLKSFDRYYNAFFGYQYPSFLLPFMGTTVMDYSKPDGFIDVITFDSCSEAEWIASEKELLTFISGEPSPADPLFDGGFGDMFSRVLDDGTVPLPAQYIDEATVVYYGVKQHESVFRDLEENGARDVIAKTIVDFLLGNQIMVSSKVDQGIESFSRTSFFADNSFNTVVCQDTSVEFERDHFEVQIARNSSVAHQSEVDVAWNEERMDDCTVKMTISHLRPFGRISINWKVFESVPFSRNPYKL